MRRVKALARSTAPASAKYFTFNRNKSKGIGNWVYDGLKKQGCKIKIVPKGMGYRVFIASPKPLWDDSNWCLENFDRTRKWIWWGAWTEFVWRIGVEGGDEIDGKRQPYRVVADRIEWLSDNGWSVEMIKRQSGFTYRIIVLDDKKDPVGIWTGTTQILAWALTTNDTIQEVRARLARDVPHFQWLTSDVQKKKEVCRLSPPAFRPSSEDTHDNLDTQDLEE